MDSSVNVLTFTALRGKQAGRWYYSVMCPLKIVPRMFQFLDEDMPAGMRAQRILNKSRIPEMSRYLVENPTEYTFSSITASIDGEVEFTPFDDTGNGKDIGQLRMPLTSRFLINDGQHRRAAIEEAIKQRPELGEETISVVFFIDGGLKRSQQMFADLNRHAIRPTKSLGILYDHRDALSQLARDVVKGVSYFRNLTELEKTTISNRSSKIFTLSSIYQATRALLEKSKTDDVSQEESDLAIAFWEEVGKNIHDWGLAVNKDISCGELRKDYIHSHGIALQAIGNAGATLIFEHPTDWPEKLQALRKMDWAKSNTGFWEGRALAAGRVSKSLNNVMLTTVAVKQCLGLQLTSREQEAETQRAANEPLETQVNETKTIEDQG
mgnify:CR=1 FL=1